MLTPTATYHSRELAWDVDDVAVLYTDGLAEARNGDALFGEDGVASMIRRDPTASPDVLTKVLVEAARDFAGGPDHRRSGRLGPAADLSEPQVRGLYPSDGDGAAEPTVRSETGWTGPDDALV